MCDFRQPPDYIINPYTNQPSGYLYRGLVLSKYWSSKGFNNEKRQQDVTEDGVYYICATGGGYGLYLNGEWFGYSNMYWENKDWCQCFPDYDLSDRNNIEYEYMKVNADIIPYCKVEIND